MGSAFGAGAGADMLQEILRRKFAEAIALKNQDLQAQHLQLQRQQEQNQRQYQNQTVQWHNDEVAARDTAEKRLRGRAVADTTPMGTRLNPDAKTALDESGLGSTYQHQDATLGSTNLSGVASTGQKAPRILGLARTDNPGAAEGDIYTGTAAQQASAAHEKQAEADRQQARTDRINAAALANQNHQDMVRLSASLKPAPQQPLVLVDQVDDQGRHVKTFEPKVSGKSFVQPANATTATRVASAETVNEVGTDMIKKLSDPKFAKQLGPVMGKYNTLRDFVGNPPPEFSELAGQIESYALANMGVHGMRSTEGAQKIIDLMGKHHTPESLAATIRGLNDFSTRFVQHNKPTAGGGPTPPPAASGSALDILNARRGGGL